MQEHANSTSVVCLKCGEPLKDGQRFCPKCGADRETAKNRVCVKCGAQIGDGQTFCTECGAKYLDPDSGIAKAKKVCKKVLIGLLIALGLFIALIVVVLCTGNTHHHQWADATCIAPKTCTECGKTEAWRWAYAGGMGTGSPGLCCSRGADVPKMHDVRRDAGLETGNAQHALRQR